MWKVDNFEIQQIEKYKKTEFQRDGLVIGLTCI